MIRHVYASNAKSPSYVKQTSRNLKREIDSSTIIVGNLSTNLNGENNETVIQQGNNRAHPEIKTNGLN